MGKVSHPSFLIQLLIYPNPFNYNHNPPFRKTNFLDNYVNLFLLCTIDYRICLYIYSRLSSGKSCLATIMSQKNFKLDYYIP